MQWNWKTICTAVVCVIAVILSSAQYARGSEPQEDWKSLSAQICGRNGDYLSPDAWFPTATTAAPVRMRPAAVTMDSSAQIIRANEQTLVPLPSGEWTGLSCLLGLALVRARKVIRKMLV